MVEHPCNHEYRCFNLHDAFLLIELFFLTSKSPIYDAAFQFCFFTTWCQNLNWMYRSIYAYYLLLTSVIRLMTIYFLLIRSQFGLYGESSFLCTRIISMLSLFNALQISYTPIIVSQKENYSFCPDSWCIIVVIYFDVQSLFSIFSSCWVQYSLVVLCT